VRGTSGSDVLDRFAPFNKGPIEHVLAVADNDAELSGFERGEARRPLQARRRRLGESPYLLTSHRRVASTAELFWTTPHHPSSC
jgi:hypothetical protein